MEKDKNDVIDAVQNGEIPSNIQDALSTLASVTGSMTESVDMKGIARAFQSVAPSITTRGVHVVRRVNREESTTKENAVRDEGEESIEISEEASKIKEFLNNHHPVMPKSVRDVVNCTVNMDALDQKKKQEDRVVSTMSDSERDKYPEILHWYEQLSASLQNQEELIETYLGLKGPPDIGLIRENFEYLMRENGISEDDVEFIFKKGTGYYKRALNPNDPKRRMSVESIVELCKLFHVSLDRFVWEKLDRKSNPGVLKTKKFIEKMVQMTTEARLKWIMTFTLNNTKRFSEDDLNGEQEYIRIALNHFTFFPAEEEFESVEIWSAKYKNGFAHLYVYTFPGLRNRYLFVVDETDTGGECGIAFDTSDDGSMLVIDKCDEFYQVIKEYRNVYHLDQASELVMDKFLSDIE